MTLALVTLLTIFTLPSAAEPFGSVRISGNLLVFGTDDGNEDNGCEAVFNSFAGYGGGDNGAGTRFANALATLTKQACPDSGVRKLKRQNVAVTFSVCNGREHSLQVPH